MDGSTIVILLIAIVALVLAVKAWRRKVRRHALLSKYGDPQLVENIMAGNFWQGMTQEQLVDSIGLPVDSATKVLKAKTVHTLKYQQTGRNRYALRITIENGFVTGWDKK